MNSSPAPRWTVLAESQLDHHAMHSVLISLLRAAAAIQVAAAHLRSEFYPGLRTMVDAPLWYQLLAFMTGFAHQAVVVFFLISGWLVGGSLLNKFGQPDSLKLYAIDRVTRLWTVLIPTCVFALAIGILSGSLNPSIPDASATNEFSLLAFAGNLLGLQTVWLPEYGGNYPLWSLANETWYYVLFALLLCFVGRTGWVARCVPALLLVAIGVLLPLPMLLYFSLWLLGAGFSRVRIDCGAQFKWLTLALLVSLSVYFRLLGETDGQTVDSFLQDLMLSLPLLVLLSASHARVDEHRFGMRQVRRWGNWFSGFSFTMYVVHIPLLFLVRHVLRVWFGVDSMDARTLADLGLYIAMLAGVIGFAYGFYLLFEARTTAIRSAVKQLVFSTARTAQSAA